MSSVGGSGARLWTDLTEAYDRFEMEKTRYLVVVVLPALIFAIVALAAPFLFPLPTIAAVGTGALGLLALFTAIGYPKIEIDRRRMALENQYHLVVTHMTVLSTTNIDRMEVFRTIANEREYGEFAKEFTRVVELVDSWNQSLDDACRRRAKAVPSDTVSDFFDRLAYTINAGQPLDEFLLDEQSVMIEEYATAYESSLDNLDVMKDIYLSMLMSMTFGLVFAVVLPLLTGTDPTLTILIVLVVFVFVQLGFLFVIRSLVPYDPIWFQAEAVRSAAERRAGRSLAVGAVLSVVVLFAFTMGLAGVAPFAAILTSVPIPRPLYVAIPITPLLIPGLVFRIEEGRVKDRDKEFPSFIRALGAAESAKQSTTSRVLATLRQKDFGPLTDDVDGLFRRLNMRVDAAKAWRLFAAEANSYLIQKFSEMYLVGRQMGGEPKQLGELISENMNHVNQLRQQRQQATVTMIGLLYGITAASSFAFFIGFKIVDILAGMSLDLTASSQLDVGRLIHTQVYDLPLIQFLLLGVVMINAILSALIIRTVDGGHKANALLHFVMLTWIGCAVAVLTMSVVGGLLNV